MPKKSADGKVVRRSAEQLTPPTKGRLAELLAGMGGPVDTSDAPEMKGDNARVRRNASGQIPGRRVSPTRSAILEELERRQMTRYQLWKAANAHCPTLSQSAVYEYLRGQRDISLSYAEALMIAAGLGVCRVGRKAPPG